MALNQDVFWLPNSIEQGEQWSALPDDSRVWLHCANRVLTDAEATQLAQGIQAFLAEWSAHGQSLEASWRLEGRRCLMVALNERSADATGCSIDKLVHWLQGFRGNEGEVALHWMERNQVVYNKVSNQGWQEDSLQRFWVLRKAKAIDDSTLVVNTVLQSKFECEPSLVVPFGQSWHAEVWR